jgi:uncharacterized protein
VNYSRNPLKFNVGFLLSQPVGTSREIHFDIPDLDILPEITLAQFKGTAQVSRTSQAFLVQCDFQAFTPMECVRCLDTYDQMLHTNFNQVYVLDEEMGDETNLVLSKDANIDLEPLACDYFLLEVPISPVCGQECKGLCPICGENLNKKKCIHFTGEEPAVPQGRLGALLEVALREETQPKR